MPAYTRQELLAAVKKEHPGFANVPDDELFRTLATEHPDLIKGLDEMQAPAQAPKKSWGQRALDFISGANDTANPLPAIEQAVQHPYDTVRGIGHAGEEQLGQAVQAGKEGRYSEAFGHGLAWLLPFVGPAAAKAGEEIGAGNVDRGLGQTAGLLGTAGHRVMKEGGVKAMETGAKAAGKLGVPDRLQDLAVRARAIKENAPPVIDSLAKTSITHPMTALQTVPAAAHGVVGAGAGAVESMASKASEALVRRGAKPPTHGAVSAAPALQTDPNELLRAQAPESGLKIQPSIPGDPLNVSGSRATGLPAELADVTEHPAFNEPVMQATDPGAISRSAYNADPLSPAFPPEAPVEQPMAADPNSAIQPIKPETMHVMQQLLRRGKGSAGAPLALENAQYLLKEMPELARLKDKVFDAAVANRIKITGDAMDAAFDSVEKGTTISTEVPKLELWDISKEAAAAGDNVTAKKINAITDLLDDNRTEWAKIKEIKQGLFEHGLDLTSEYGKAAYNIYRNLVESKAPALVELNRRYFTLKTATELAEMKTGTGEGFGMRPKAEYKAAEQAAKPPKVEKPKVDPAVKAEEARKALEKKRQEAAAEKKRKEDISRSKRPKSGPFMVGL